MRYLLLLSLFCCFLNAQEKLPNAALFRIGSTAWRAPEANDFAISADSKTIAVPIGTREVRFWDATTGETTGALTGPSAPASLAFTPDGKGMLVRADLERLQLWDATTSKAGREFKKQDEILTLAQISPDGKWLAAAHGESGKFKSVTVWGLGSGRAFFTASGDAKNLTGLAISPDSGLLATVGTEGKVTLFDPIDGAVIAKLSAPKETSFKSHLAFVDAKTLITLTGVTAQRWDLTKKELVTGFDLPASASALSSDGKWIALVRPGKVELWDTATQKLAKSMPCEIPGHVQVKFAPDGSFLALLTTSGALKVWNLTTGAERSAAGGHGAAITALEFSPDGTALLSASADNTARLWDAATGKEIRTYGEPSHGLQRATFAPDGKTLAAGGGYGTILLFETASGKQVQSLKDAGRSFAFSPDGKTLASLTSQRNEEAIRLWDVTAGKEQFQIPGPKERPTTLLFHPDGKTLALGNLSKVKASEQKTLFLDLATTKSSASIEGRPVAFSPDGKRILTLDSDGLQVWDMAKARVEKAYPIKGLQVQVAAWSPDGKTLAVAQSTTIMLFDADGKERGRLPGHNNTIEVLTFSADGKRLASGGRDTLIFVWNLVR